MAEIGQSFKRMGKIMSALSVRDILDEAIGRKLA